MTISNAEMSWWVMLGAHKFLKVVFGIHHWQPKKSFHRQASLSAVKGKILIGNLFLPFHFYIFE